MTPLPVDTAGEKKLNSDTGHSTARSDEASTVRAAQVQRERDDADLANHLERLQWLGGERPCWSCGTPVDAHMRQVLAIQSRAAIARANGGAA